MSEMSKYQKNMVDQLKEHSYNPKELSNEISLAMNSFFIETDEMIQEITVDKNAKAHMDEISWYWIRIAAENFKEQYTYDDRNEASYETCFQLYNCKTGKKHMDKLLPDFDTRYLSRYELPDLKGGYQVVIKMQRDHRTIQQTFTGFIFSYLTKTSSVFNKMANEIGYDKLGYLPMI